jgi:hypothetical protein
MNAVPITVPKSDAGECQSSVIVANCPEPEDLAERCRFVFFLVSWLTQLNAMLRPRV